MTVKPVIFWKCSTFLVMMVYPFVRVIAPMRASLSPIGCPFVSSSAQMRPAVSADLSPSGRRINRSSSFPVAGRLCSRSLDLWAPWYSSNAFMTVVDSRFPLSSISAKKPTTFFTFLKRSISISCQLQFW